MIDKDLLKRRIDTYNNLISRLDRITSANYMHIVAGMRCTLKAMIDNNLAIIDSTQENPCEGCTNRKGCVTCENGELRETMQEEPVSEDNTLRKASEEYLKVLSETPYNNTPITNVQTIVRELITFLDNPSKYNPNHIEEPISDDLEEACDSYYDETWDEHGGRAMVVDGCHDIWFPSHATDDFFKAGAKWQKEQMMAKAKSGTVQKDNQVILDNGTYIDLDPSMQLKPSFVGLKEGDRIKVIVIKEG